MVADGSAAPPSERRPLRVAIVGAGPAGIFAADALTRQDDVYLTTTQTRVKIETQKSGGGTSVNSGGFSHSSGKF